MDLIKITREALAQGIMACGPGRPFSDIGRKINDLVAQHGYSVNQQFTGHGIGKVFHRPPWILHHSKYKSLSTLLNQLVWLMGKKYATL